VVLCRSRQNLASDATGAELQTRPIRPMVSSSAEVLAQARGAELLSFVDPAR
jgi:hypothetical protein